MAVGDAGDDAISGFARPVRRLISPGAFMPISCTAGSAAAGRAASVSGTPRWLLKLARLAWQPPSCRSMCASISLLPVLPTEPVIATSLPPASRCASRPAAPRDVSAASTSPTVRSRQGASATGCETSAATAPLPAAAATKPCPSACCPGRAANRLPAPQRRLSISIPVTVRSGMAPVQLPPVRRASSAAPSAICCAMPVMPCPRRRSGA